MNVAEIYCEAQIRYEKLIAIGRSPHEALQGAVDVAIHNERERCAKIAEASTIPGHTVVEPVVRSIAETIREGAWPM